MNELIVLAYHKIGLPSCGATPTRYYISERTFEQHLCSIAEAGWSVASHDDFICSARARHRPPKPQILISFDDAYSGTCENAARILKSYAYPFVVFVPTGYVGDTNRWDLGIEPIEQICDWSQLEQLQASGGAIESHSRSHRRFSHLSQDDLLVEFYASRREMQEMLGVTATSLAYPYGDPGLCVHDTASLLARTGYEAAFLYDSSPVRCATDNMFLLSRVAVFEETNIPALLSQMADSSEHP